MTEHRKTSGKAIVAAAMLLSIISAQSQGAPIFSESFESPDTTGRVTNSPAGWVSTRIDKTGINDAAIADKTGVQYAFVDDYPNTGLFDGALTTTSAILGSNLTAWVHYTLTCDVAVLGIGCVGAIDLLAGTNVIASVTNAPSKINDFSFTDALVSRSSTATISLIPTSSHPSLGSTLSIRLRKVAGAWNHDILFDNLTLDASDTTGDTNAPIPGTMLWHGSPVAAPNNGITMTAAIASDPNHVQYCFTNTVNGNSSGWIDHNVWTDTGLPDGVTYIYKVKARDNSANYNETSWSAEASATADASVLLYESFETPPHVDVASFIATNSQGWILSTTLSGTAGLHDEEAGTFTTPYGTQAAYVYDNGGAMNTKYSMTHMGAVLEVGTQYLLSFNVAAENNGSAGYGVDLLAGTNVIDSATGAPGNRDMSVTSILIDFTPTPDHPNMGEPIGVQLRKPTGVWNGGHIVFDNIRLRAVSTDSDVTAPSPDPMIWHEAPIAVSDNRICMIATPATDVNGVQYYFTNTVNGHVSGWQNSPGWTDTGLTANTAYRYKVKVRDNSSNLNESDWSPEKSATMVPGILFYDSFEAPPHTDVDTSVAMDSVGWIRTGADDAGLTDVASGNFITPYGSQAAYVYDNMGTLGHSYTATSISNALQAGLTYTLTFNVASDDGGPAGYGVDLIAGTNVIATTTGAPGNSDISATRVAMSFTPTPDSPSLGQILGVRLRKPTGAYTSGQIVYDHVRLTALPAGYSPLVDGGQVAYDYVAAPFEVTVDEYVTYLNATPHGELSISGGQVFLASTSNLLCLATNADPLAYVAYDPGAPAGSQFSSVTDRGDHPMIFVSWFGAAAYCNWKSSVEGLDAVYSPADGWTSVTAMNGYRLPTEAEWNKAAAWNAASGRFYRYGTASDLISTTDANFVNSGDTSESNAVRTTPVGSYSTRSPYGLYDASGNVSEWCNDLYSGNAPAVGPHAIRGGGWGHPAAHGLTSARFARKPGQATSGVGFRTARTVIWE